MPRYKRMIQEAICGLLVLAGMTGLTYIALVAIAEGVR